MSGMFIHVIATFVLSVFLVIVLRRLTVAFHLVDRPDSIRKRHKGDVPLCGGIAVFTAFTIVSLLDLQPEILGMNFWLGLLVILLMGMIDDRRPLPAAGRLVMQLLMAIALVGGANIGALSVGTLFSQTAHLFLPLFFVIGVLFVTGLVNSWNMLDGVDGLAGGTALVALIWLMFVASFADMMRLVAPLEALAVCLCAFLVFNMRSPWRLRASIFLGDAGSTALGATIAYIILLLATGSVAVTFPALVWVVIVPVTDTLSLIVRRLMASRSPMSADRWHLHHLLLDHGLSASATTNTLIFASAICGGIGYAGMRAEIPGEVMAIGLLVPICLHTIFVLAATGHLSKSWSRRGRFDLLAQGTGMAGSSSEAAFPSPLPSTPLKDE